MIHEKTANAPLNGRFVKWLAVIFYSALIFFLSSLSNPSPVELPHIFMFDKVLHFIEYAILGFLLFGAFMEESWAKSPVLLSFLAATAYGMSDEFHQYFVAFRESDLLDLLADSAGGGAGAFLASRFPRGVGLA